MGGSERGQRRTATASPSTWPGRTGGRGSSGEDPGFAGTLDYIWYSPSSLEAMPGTLVPMPSLEQACAQGGGLPNAEVPSDHVPLGAAFREAPDGSIRGRLKLLTK